MSDEKKKRGGYRAGSGRKPELVNPMMLTCYIERADVEAIENLGVPVLRFIREAVKEKLKRES